jgi:hypothetical protein
VLAYLGFAAVASAAGPKRDDAGAKEGEPAAAPDAGGPSTAPEGEAATTPAPAAIGAAGTLVTWSREGPDLSLDLVAVAVSPEDPAKVAVMSRDGRVYLSRDAGTSWTQELSSEGALGGRSRDEDALLDVETRMNELIDELGSYADPEEIEDAGIGDELIADVRSGATVYEQLTGAAAIFAPVGHLRFEPGGRLRAARPDGLWVLDLVSERWSHPLREPVVDCGQLGSLVLCGGPDGAWLSQDEISWTRATSAPAALIYEVRVTEGAMYVATVDGLFRTVDGVAWTDLRSPAPALSSSGTVDSLRVSDGDTVWWRGEDAVWNRGPDVLLARVYALKPGPDGTLFAAGAAGLVRLESGEAWRRVGEDVAFEARSVAFDREGVLTAGPLGLVHGRATPKAVSGGAPRAWIPLEKLLLAAETRNGVDPRRGALGPAGQALVWLMPEVRVDYARVWATDTVSRIDQGLFRSPVLFEGVTLTATWRPPRASLNATDTTVVVDEDGAEANVFVSGGDNWIALGRVSRRAAQHRLEVAEEIRGLYQRHDELGRQLETEGMPLLDSVHLRLRLAEIEARIDALTDGAVQRFESAQVAVGGG